MSANEKLTPIEDARPRDMTEGYKIIQALRSAMKVAIKKHATVDEVGNVTYNRADAQDSSVGSGIVEWRLELAFDKMYAEIRDQIEYELRKEWAQRREAERTEKQIINHPPINGG